MKENFTWKRGSLAGIITLFLILFDQWTKSLAVKHLMNQQPLLLIPKVFQLRYLENKGAAFGMMEGQQTFFIVMACIVCLAIGFLYFKMPWSKRFHLMRGVGILIASGAIGNLIDRVFLGYVVDFFYFELIDFPIFNVADIYVTVATAVMAILIIFYYTEEELESIFPSKKEKN